MAFNHEKGLCAVSHENKLIFIGVPANASTSIRNALNLKGYDNNYISILSLGSKEIDYPTFAIVRDPIERLISGYLKVCDRATGDSPHILKTNFYKLKDQKKRFYEFVNELERGMFDCHIERQCFYLTDSLGKPFEIDYYLKVENLSEDFSRMCKKLGLKCTLTHLNEAKSERPQKTKLVNLKEIFKTAFENRTFKESMFFIIFKLLNVVKFLITSRPPLPTKSEVRAFLKNDPKLLQRLFILYKSDFDLYKKGK
jgi:hypothetical protein